MVSAPRKVTGSHLQRLAVIYVRQSTLAQVRFHRESTERQYALGDEAAKLGWDRDRIVVVDQDLGLSGRDAQKREGFKELVGRVCCGEVGAIFGLEVSRLARSSADLQRLLELSALTDTLIVDADGIYDLHDFNDRLLLGLKGTMSEAELHILAGRLQGAKRAAAQCRARVGSPWPASAPAERPKRRPDLRTASARFLSAGRAALRAASASRTASRRAAHFIVAWRARRRVHSVRQRLVTRHQGCRGQPELQGRSME